MYTATSFIEDLRSSINVALVGGKAANLARLLAAGFNVPDGFVINTRAYIHARDDAGGELSEELRAQIIDAYQRLGAGPLAVRSSATAEDMQGASMAGQYETFLDVNGEEELITAIQRCWGSLNTPRSHAYLREHGIDPSDVLVAVIVQKLIPSDSAGVLFTENPSSPTSGHLEMLLEASWGLGDSLVSGRVQPDVLCLERATGRVLSAKVADKRVLRTSGAPDRSAVDSSRRHMPCLSSRDVHRIWQLGLRVAEHFGAPQDIEWALCDGEVYLIQSRPITTPQSSREHTDLVRSTQERLRRLLEANQGPWVLHNLSETLPHPTPLTWSVIRRFMSGSGGYGAMYRQAGFEPAPVVDADGFLESIAGRMYMDVSRAPEIFFEDFPFAYDLEALKSNPQAAQSPPTLPRGSLAARWRAVQKLKAVQAQLDHLSERYDLEVREYFIPKIVGSVAEAKHLDLPSLRAEGFVGIWRSYEKMALQTYAPRLLLPSLICAMAIEQLRAFLQEHFWDEDAEALAELISTGGRLNSTIQSDIDLYRVGRGELPLKNWIEKHGHRAAGEFDLSSPRWREQPDVVLERAKRLASGDDPAQRHEQAVEKVNQKVQTLRSQLAATLQTQLDARIDLVRRYIAFREDGKDILILAYDLLRDLALEAGRRLEIGTDVFFLTSDELVDAINVGFAPCEMIAQRKRRYAAEVSLILPRVIDASVIDSLGTAQDLPVPTNGGYPALGISSGQAVGTARIVNSPDMSAELGKGYILVCPSTDPSWTPLFVNAAGLVLECGGSLSHGAVVAREMGLPAVVLPDAMRIFKDGQELCVNGSSGWVGAPAALASESDIVDQLRLPAELIPPIPGRKERGAARVRNALALLWLGFLAACYLLPRTTLFDPTLRLMDAILWPFVAKFGKPATVATLAGSIAALTLILQRFATDNTRLREAKHRVNKLHQRLKSLSADSPLRAEIRNLTTQVQRRTFLAAMVPIGILLGPMVLAFIWCGQRMDPATWNASAGSTVSIIALIDGEFQQPLELQSVVATEPSTPNVQTLPPLRKTLEQLLELYRTPQTNPDQPWQLTVAPNLALASTISDLEAYLSHGIPAQQISWVLQPTIDQTEFDITVTAPGQPPLVVRAALGDRVPPRATTLTTPLGPVIKELRVVYPKSKTQMAFFRPLRWIPGSRFAAIDVGWLGLYILVYLPVLLLMRWGLKVA